MLEVPGWLDNQRLPNAVAVVSALQITARVRLDCSRWRFLYAKHHAWIAHSAKLDSESQSVGSAAMLADKRQVGVTERVVSNQIVLIVG